MSSSKFLRNIGNYLPVDTAYYLYLQFFNPFVTSGTYMSHLQKSLFKSAGITVSHFFSMLPSNLKYLYSVEPVRMHFPAKQPYTNDTVCNAACSIAHSITVALKIFFVSGTYMSHWSRKS